MLQEQVLTIEIMRNKNRNNKIFVYTFYFKITTVEIIKLLKILNFFVFFFCI
jgi:hypothetical protein